MFGKNVLNQLIARKEWKAVLERCHSHPHEAGKQVRCKFLDDGIKKSKANALHHACALHAPKEVVLKLISTFGGALEERETAYNRLPLHIAAHHASPKDVLLTLFDKYPLAVTETDNLGRVPLHYAIANGTSMEFILKLLNSNTRTAHICDFQGWNSLHVACGVGAPAILVKSLLQANPVGVVVKSLGGSTPLDFAKTFKNKKKDVVKLCEEATLEVEKEVHRVKDDMVPQVQSKKTSKNSNNQNACNSPTKKFHHTTALGNIAKYCTTRPPVTLHEVLSVFFRGKWKS